jgi:hypothetical protein
MTKKDNLNGDYKSEERRREEGIDALSWTVSGSFPFVCEGPIGSSGFRNDNARM